MKAYEQIIDRQKQWAKSQGIDLIGSAGERGEKNYTLTLSENLFEPLSRSAIASFSNGNGNEITSTPEHTAKMNAIHSSSALGVNVFHYWQTQQQYAVIASACGFSDQNTCPTQEITFEKKFAIPHVQRIPPHLDIAFRNAGNTPFEWFAIESKFTEPFSPRGHGGLNPTYLQYPELWDNFPHLFELGKLIEGEDHKFRYLHAAQLIKHIQGLSYVVGKNRFNLLYLWYDLPGEESEIHRQEIKEFQSYTKADGVEFNALTYQILFQNLKGLTGFEHALYIKYLETRYF